MPTRTVMARNRVANAMAMSWLLSPSSATKMMPKLIRKADTVLLSAHTEQRAGMATSARQFLPDRKSRPPLLSGSRDRVHEHQYVDHVIADYSPSMSPSVVPMKTGSLTRV